ncbi:hypothetical protein [Glacieibacterium sp.]
MTRAALVAPPPTPGGTTSGSTLVVTVAGWLVPIASPPPGLRLYRLG